MTRRKIPAGALVPTYRWSWLAARDGIAHARRMNRLQARTACGLRPVDERFAWPERERCPACLAVVAA